MSVDWGKPIWFSDGREASLVGPRYGYDRNMEWNISYYVVRNEDKVEYCFSPDGTHYFNRVGFSITNVNPNPSVKDWIDNKILNLTTEETYGLLRKVIGENFEEPVDPVLALGRKTLSDYYAGVLFWPTSAELTRDGKEDESNLMKLTLAAINAGKKLAES